MWQHCLEGGVGIDSGSYLARARILLKNKNNALVTMLALRCTASSTFTETPTAAPTLALASFSHLSSSRGGGGSFLSLSTARNRVSSVPSEKRLASSRRNVGLH